MQALYMIDGGVAVCCIRCSVCMRPPLNPQQLANVTPDSSFNTAISFVINTNWRVFGGEATPSYLFQMLGPTTHSL